MSLVYHVCSLHIHDGHFSIRQFFFSLKSEYLRRAQSACAYPASISCDDKNGNINMMKLKIMIIRKVSDNNSNDTIVDIVVVIKMLITNNENDADNNINNNTNNNIVIVINTVPSAHKWHNTGNSLPLTLRATSTRQSHSAEDAHPQVYADFPETFRRRGLGLTSWFSRLFTYLDLFPVRIVFPFFRFCLLFCFSLLPSFHLPSYPSFLFSCFFPLFPLPPP